MAPEQALQVLGVEERLARDHALARHEELPRLLWLVSDRGPDPEHFVARGLEPRGVEVVAEVVRRRLVPAALIIAQRVIERPASRQTIVECLDEQIGVSKGIAHAEREHRILVTAGIANERPPGTVRLPEKIGQVRGALERLLPSAGS